MAKAKAVWGIDIGQCALKALKVIEVDGELQVDAFEVIEHPKILSQPEVNRREYIHAALERFVSTQNVSGCLLAVAVPGQSSFTRFVKLPPVEPKKIPDIVRFEAEQQIPFPVEEVIWQWQTFQDADNPDVEVGIFAMKRSDIRDMLDHFTDMNVHVDVVQMAPLALYDFMKYDNQVGEDGATLLADVGADKTDLVVGEGTRIWTRTIQIGGDNFTQALAKAFKLSFPKAEKLKRTAATSKYARQIFQAMRPVFADLVQEIQRSIGYYTSLHREARFKRLIGLGNGFRLPGLQKFLEQSLSIPVVRIDGYNKTVNAEKIDAPAFSENVLSFAVAYGLAIQALRQTTPGTGLVVTNMLPDDISRRRLWSRKRPWFAGAAAAVLIALALPVHGNFRDTGALQSPEALQNLNEAKAVVSRFKLLQRDMTGIENKRKQAQEELERCQKLFAYRNFWPAAQSLISRTFYDPQADKGEQIAPMQELLQQCSQARNRQEQEKLIAQIKAKPRAQREYFIVEQVKAVYCPDIQGAPWDAAIGLPAAGPTPARGVQGQRGFMIVIAGRTPLPPATADAKVAALIRRSEEIAKLPGQPFTMLDKARSVGKPSSPAPASPMPTPPAARSGGGAEAVASPDPLIPDETVADDTLFRIGLKLAITDDGTAAATGTKSP